MEHIITPLLVFLPIIAGILVLFVRGKMSAYLALGISALQLLLTFWAMSQFVANETIQFAVRTPWIAQMGVDFYVGIDGISILMVFLTNVLCPIIVLAAMHRDFTNNGLFYGLLLIMQGALVGVFVSQNAFLYYVFWEMVLIPAYFIILQWGDDNRRAVTLKFFIYTVAGSLFMLVALIYLYTKTETGSFNVDALYATNLSDTEQMWIFAAFMLAFMIKIPVFPFHTWQPATYTTAPNAGTMLLSGIMLKMGLYSIIRWVLPVVPVAVSDWGSWVMVLGAISVVYASVIAIRQPNIKTLFAYSSMAHVGMVAIAVMSATQLGLQGSLLQMVSHGVNIVAAFYICEIFLTRNVGLEIAAMGGIRLKAPVFSSFFLIFVMASVGLPLTNSFVGEYLMITGIFEYSPWLAAFAGTSIILGAVYMLRTYQRSMLGETNENTKSFFDLKTNEIVVLSLLTILVFVFGLYPKPFLQMTEPAVVNLLNNL